MMDVATGWMGVAHSDRELNAEQNRLIWWLCGGFHHGVVFGFGYHNGTSMGILWEVDLVTCRPMGNGGPWICGYAWLVVGLYDFFFCGGTWEMMEC